MALRDMRGGVYPDGVEDEETASYHEVTNLDYLCPCIHACIQPASH